MIMGNKSLYILKSPLFAGSYSIVHAFTSRKGGVSSPPFDSMNLSAKTGDDEERVKQNLLILKEGLNLKDDLFFLDQVHGCDILVIKGAHPFQGRRTFDAVITDRRRFPVAIMTADCLPLIIHDPDKGLIGAVHAGWRGTAAGITGKTIDKMVAEFGCNAENIIVATGPGIGPCCYEVDKAVFEAFRKKGHNWDKISSAAKKEGEERWMLDIAKANAIQLCERGVRKENISHSPYCTCCRADLFYSHRRDGRSSGRQGAVIMLQ